MRNAIFKAMFVCTFTLLAYSAHSQVIISLLFGDKLNTPKLEFGLHAGANFSTLSGLDEAKWASSLNLGFYFDIYLTERLRLTPEVWVKSTSGARNLDPYETGEPALDELIKDAKLEVQINYFQVPILLKYKILDHWHISAGIQPAMRGRTRDVFTDEVFDKNDLVFESNVGDQYTRLDFGVAARVSWRPKQDRGVTFVVHYSHGLVNVLKDNPGDPVRNRNIALGALIPIGVKKAEARRAEEADKEGE